VIGLLVYGISTAVLICVGIPIDALLVYVVPQLQFNGYFQENWFIELAEFVSAYGPLLIPVVLVVLTVVITGRVSSRWDRLVMAWNG
jgi:hypothetical protein